MRSFFRETFINVSTVLLIALSTALLTTIPFLQQHSVVIAALLGVEIGQKLKAFIASKIPV